MTALASSAPAVVPTPTRRVGVLGGAFDPPHLTHVGIARQAVAQLQLDALHVIPSGRPPHRCGAVASGQQRLQMLGLAMAGIAAVRLDPREVLCTETGFTLHTLQALRAEYPSAELFLIVGQDQWLRFAGWHLPQEVVKLATVCVAKRVENTRTDEQKNDKILGLENEAAAPSAQKQVLWLQLQATDLSATAVRRALQEGNEAALRNMLDPAVLRYIADNRLYGYPDPPASTAFRTA